MDVNEMSNPALESFHVHWTRGGWLDRVAEFAVVC